MSTYEQGQRDGAAGVRPGWDSVEYLRGYGPIEMGPWRAASGGNGRGAWFVLRESVPWNSRTEYHEDVAGNPVRYNMAGAFKGARELNAAAKPTKIRH